MWNISYLHRNEDHSLSCKWRKTRTQDYPLRKVLSLCMGNLGNSLLDLSIIAIMLPTHWRKSAVSPITQQRPPWILGALQSFQHCIFLEWVSRAYGWFKKGNNTFYFDIILKPVQYYACLVGLTIRCKRFKFKDCFICFLCTLCRCVLALALYQVCVYKPILSQMRKHLLLVYLYFWFLMQTKGFQMHLNTGISCQALI